jgi:hypothetical protein
MGTGTIRLGGVCGVVSAAVIVPAYAAGSPEAPRGATAAREYFDGATRFLTVNGSLPLLHLLLGLAFLGVLLSMLRSAAGPTGAVYCAVIGAAVFLALTAGGLAAEVAVPTAIVRFGDVTVTDYAQPYLGLAQWLYHYSHIGSAAVIFATAYIVWRTGVLPKWSAGLAVLGVPALLHTWIGLPAAYCVISWFALTGLLMAALPPVVRVASDPV